MRGQYQAARRIDQLQRHMQQIGSFGVGTNNYSLGIMCCCNFANFPGQQELTFIALHVNAIPHLQLHDWTARLRQP